MERINFISKEAETPCFILDRGELVRSITGFQSALSNCFSESTIGYSVKTNSLPYCLWVAKEHNCFAEVVSVDEYELALLCGFQKDCIIYNGPMKSRETFLDAITNGAIVNIETHRELDWLKDLPKEGKYNVGLRLNVNISNVSPEDADGEYDDSRFGFSNETNEFASALNTIQLLPNVKLAGLHIHRTTHNRSIGFYRNSIQYACGIIVNNHLELDYLDVGGGYFGIFSNKPTYQHYADAFKEVLVDFGLDNMRVIVEPGNALVASSFSFLSEVIDVKHVEGNKWFITTDGSRNDIDPFFRKVSYNAILLYNEKEDVVEEQVISGCTCLENDRLFTIMQKPLMKVGDRIVYKNVGAYTMCLTPLFIRYIPNVYVYEDNQLVLIRSKWSANEFIQKSILK